jgi:hypothetical protein
MNILIKYLICFTRVIPRAFFNVNINTFDVVTQTITGRSTEKDTSHVTI